jgi:hypothetical protein
VSGPRRLGSLLAAWDAAASASRTAARNKGWAGADQAGAALWSAWESAVGPTIARASLPFKFRGGVLSVLTASSSWSNELTYLAPQILEKLRRAVPETKLRTLRFMVASGRTRMLLERERVSARTGARPLQPRSTSPAEAPPAFDAMKEQTDMRELAAHLASQQRALNEWRDRAGFGRCRCCGARFAGAAKGPTLCAPCSSEQRRSIEAQVELALTAAPWMAWREVRRALPHVARATYQSTRRRLLTRWECEINTAQRRLRRASLTPQDRVIAWSYLMLLTGLPQRDIGRAVTRDVLGPAWTTALFAPTPP